jgi:predicted TPR repeat methyltransferase
MALALLAADAPAEALASARQACELDPDWPDAWFVLADCASRADEPAVSVEAYRRCLDLDPTDRLGASLRLALLAAAPAPDRIPAAHVRQLFDEYAASFEQSLVDRLAYQGPGLLEQAIARHLADMPAPLTVIDIGCGTGLAGAAVRRFAGRLDGFDLAPRIVEAARRKGIYDAVWVADLFDGPVSGRDEYGLAVAADMLCYVGDLAPAFEAIARFLRPAGWLAFTVETGETASWSLGIAQRFRHRPDAVRQWLLDTGFQPEYLESATLRLERREPVAGLVVLARRLR